MTRKITASAKSKEKNIQSMKIEVEIKTDYLTRKEVDYTVERIKNWAFDELRKEGFLLQEIKTN